MPRVTAREIEHYYFEQFRKHFQMPEGEVVYADKPDVRVYGARTLGVEIARLYITEGSDPASEQVQSVRRDQVLAQAQALHRRGGGRPIELNVDFDPTLPILDAGQSAKKLAKLAHEIQHHPVTLAGELSGNAEGLRFVHHNGLEYPDAKWRKTQIFSVPPLDTARLQSVVEEKTKKATDYAACDEYWLLLVVDFMDPAQDQELTLPHGFGLPKSRFEKVLVYKPQFGQVVEVPQ
jgi:hypothetical protein